MKTIPAALLILLGLPALAADLTWPDPSATPGALNPRVTQANIHETICRRGWTRTIRPPRDYTTSLKRQQLARGPYAAWHARLRDYEEDHLVPLSLGGAPWDTRNLWPEPWDDAKRKDDAEARFHHLVCAHRMTLDAAQRVFLERRW
jgi:hypothetical protein